MHDLEKVFYYGNKRQIKENDVRRQYNRYNYMFSYVILVYCLHAAASFKSPNSFKALRQGYQIKFLDVGKFSKQKNN